MHRAMQSSMNDENKICHPPEFHLLLPGQFGDRFVLLLNLLEFFLLLSIVIRQGTNMEGRREHNHT